jgi:hypothetical protein
LVTWLPGGLRWEAFLHNIFFSDEEDIPVFKRDSLDLSRNNRQKMLIWQSKLSMKTIKTVPKCCWNANALFGCLH